MDERPIIFSGDSVRAIRADEKTQTRRVVQLPRWVQRKQPNLDAAFADRGGPGNPFAPAGVMYLHVPCADDDSVQRVYSPYGHPGDRLWVRETCLLAYSSLGAVPAGNGRAIAYAADGYALEAWEKWTPSIHMHRWASRLTLEVVGVRVERVQDITTEDCIAEGLSTTLRGHDAAVDLAEQYRALWNALNTKRGHGWDVNPWVWVIEFRRHEEEGERDG
ncbi:MAG: hypothetical protein Q8K55_11400 [Gemmatimonadaceae bacterium]|nr:hypothetical protein [Gemmatimonadaceae bacterium]